MDLINKIYKKIKYNLVIKFNIHFFLQSVLRYKKVTGNNKYTIISAVYNVDKYLDDYFKSLTDQTLIFSKHIHLIMVDDGSVDTSAETIKKWKNKYPNNITYIKKENGGQASARNLGLKYVQTPWVTFIDPDDFVDVRYFEKVDNFLSQEQAQNVGLVCCKWMFYFEEDKGIADTHPLTFRFAKGNRVINPKNDKDFLPSSVATSIYKTQIIDQYHIRFDEQIRPNFEDGHFSGLYQLHIETFDVAYLAKSVYYYRKRTDGTSTLDNSWKNPSRFDKVLKNGHLHLIKEASKSYEEIPLSIQRLVLYDLFWYFKIIINNSASVSFLTEEQIKIFKELLQNIFKYIDLETIEAFNLAGCEHYHKVGLVNLYKKKKLPYQVIYIDDYNEVKNEIKIRYYHPKNEQDIIEFDSQTTTFLTQKQRRYDFLGDDFIFEKNIWLEINEDYLESFSKEGQIYFHLNGKMFQDKISLNQISKSFKIALIGRVLNSLPTHLFTIYTKDKRGLKNTWLLLDRDNQADDNAEHLYRYIRKEHSEVNIYFILRKSSYDWERLKKDDFNLIPFGSIIHLAALVQAEHLISSHADSYVTDFIPRQFFKSILKYKFTFLQHGITRDDISTWLNKKDIDCFVTSTPQEYQAIAGDDNLYKFTSKEVLLSGLARHDKLLTRDESIEKVILIMPTWRKSFVGETKRSSAQRTKIDTFYESDYARNWKSLLHSKELENLVNTYNYKVVFFPHANMQIYIDWFDAPHWMEVRTHKSDPILQKLFRRAEIMITDYSSVFFEFAVQEKALIYYQFDYDFMYGGEQQSQLGYFDFHKDGFGPVCTNEKDLLDEISHLLEQEGKPDNIYQKRMIETFPNRDGKNCQRIYEAIVQLNKVVEI